jgi:hypothetical protein
MRGLAGAVGGALVLSVVAACGAGEAEIRLDGAKRHQVYEGFGATTTSLVHEGPHGDSLGPKLRPLVLDAVYGQARLTMGNLSVGPLESPGGWNERRNDNDDPKAIEWKGFNTFHADHMFSDVVRPDAYLDEQDAIALADNDASTVLITGLGYAIGHYARWLKRGAVRIEAECPDPLVQATAFRDDAQGRLTLVVINNAAEARDLAIRLSGIRIKGSVAGEQSHGHARWEKLKPLPVDAPDRIKNQGARHPEKAYVLTL